MKRLLVILLVAAACFAQNKQVSPPAPHAQVACGTSKGCATFNEMLRNNDADLRSFKRQSDFYTTLVCFNGEKGIDSFFLVMFDRQQNLIWRTDQADSVTEHASGIFTFNDYQDGMRNRVVTEMLDWKRPAHRFKQEDALGYATRFEKEEGRIASIDEAEVNYMTTFTNATKQQTEYTLQIRRSTKRFQETIKTGGFTFTNSGHCVTFSGKNGS
jgi:hypothetical protein